MHRYRHGRPNALVVGRPNWRTVRAKAWDTFISLAATTKQWGLSFFQYLVDRVTGTQQLPALDELIDERAAALNLGASWADSY